MAGRVMSEEMRAYYHRRAAEYDDWWLGTGRFAGIERPGWAEEVDALVDVVAGLPPARVLDVACGTGFLTRHLLGDVTGLDQSVRMLAIAQERVRDGTFVQGDALELPFADDAFDRVCTGHFYGHLLPAEAEAFLREARRVAGELVLVDSAHEPGREPEQWQDRALNDGSRHRVYKRFFTAEGLAAELGGGRVRHAGRWFVVVAA